MTLAEAEAAERSAFAEIVRLGEQEFDRVRCWIASGFEGEQPKPDQAARRSLADRLSAAMAAREAAERAAGGRGGADGSIARPDDDIAATGRLCGAARAV